MFCCWFLPNGFQKYPGLIFIGSSRSPDKFDGQLACRGEPAPGQMRACLPGSDAAGLSQEVVRDRKVIVTILIRGPLQPPSAGNGGAGSWRVGPPLPLITSYCTSNLLSLPCSLPLSFSASCPQRRTPRGHRAPGTPWPTQTRALAWRTHPWNLTQRIYPVTQSRRAR